VVFDDIVDAGFFSFFLNLETRLFKKFSVLRESSFFSLSASLALMSFDMDPIVCPAADEQIKDKTKTNIR